MANNPLWEEFNLADHNPDAAGGILYALEYDHESLIYHQQVVIQKLVDFGADIHEFKPGQIGVSAPRNAEADTTDFLGIMLEELSVVNEALESEAAISMSSMAELTSAYRNSFMFIAEEGYIGDAAALVQIEVPRLVSELTVAQSENEPLSAEDFQLVQDLGEWATRKITTIRNEGIVIISSRANGIQTIGPDNLPIG